MGRAIAIGMVLALAAVGCGTTRGDHGDRVSAGPRPAFMERMMAGEPRKAPAFLPGWLPRQAAATTVPAGEGDGEVGLDRTAPVVADPAPQAPPAPLAATTGALSPAVADITPRAYVPNSDAHTLTVIDPTTFEVIAQYATGYVPHHVTPSWDMTKLYVNNTSGNTLTVLDARTGEPIDTISVIDPYNLYFTPDGSKAIVVAERLQRLDYRDPDTWELIKSVPIPGSGVDHMDFSADGRYLVASTEFSGHIVKVDNVAMEVVGEMHVGGLPIDVKMSPDGSVFYVANQGLHGVHVIDPDTMTELDFLPTGTGAHGLNYSRDTKRLFVSNRLAGTISIIDPEQRAVTETWQVGGSPDMLAVSTDGSQLWASNRFHGSVSVIDTSDGSVIKTIRTGAGAHGVCLFPQPGRFSVGHNGVFR